MVRDHLETAVLVRLRRSNELLSVCFDQGDIFHELGHQEDHGCGSVFWLGGGRASLTSRSQAIIHGHLKDIYGD